MATIKRKPKLIEEEAKMAKKAVHQIGAIPIEIPIATKVITESRLSEIESSYDKSQSRVVNKLNPEPEFELVELKKPPGYVKDQVRRWENVLTEVDDASGESPVDVDSDQRVGEQQNGFLYEHSQESVSTNDTIRQSPPQQMKETDVDGRFEEEDDIIEPTDVLLSQTQNDTIFEVLDKFPAEKESLIAAPPLHEAASTSGTPYPQVMEAKIHLEERAIPSSSSYDYKHWEKHVALVCEEDEDQEDTNLTLSDFAYATGNHIIDLSFEEKDLIKVTLEYIFCGKVRLRHDVFLQCLRLKWENEACFMTFWSSQNRRMKTTNRASSVQSSTEANWIENTPRGVSTIGDVFVMFEIILLFGFLSPFEMFGC